MDVSSQVSINSMDENKGGENRLHAVHQSSCWNMTYTTRVSSEIFALVLQFSYFLQAKEIRKKAKFPRNDFPYTLETYSYTTLHTAFYHFHKINSSKHNNILKSLLFPITKTRSCICQSSLSLYGTPCIVNSFQNCFLHETHVVVKSQMDIWDEIHNKHVQMHTSVSFQRCLC